MNDQINVEKAYWKRVCRMAGEPEVRKDPVVYVSGPISAAPMHTPEENIDLGTIAGLKLLLCGYYPVIPHLLAAELGMEGWSREHWMKLDLPVMLACDKVFFLWGWKQSVGAVIEHTAAEKNCMPMALEPILWELVTHPGNLSSGLVDPFTREFVEVKV